MGFLSRSLLIFAILYGMVLVLADLFFLQGAVPLPWVTAILLGVIALQYLLAPWLIERFLSITFYPEDIPARQREFVEELCRRQGLPPLRLGIIESATPNAFAYGRLRADARVVVTRGLLDLLSKDEIDAVLAHEVGHVAHYDFAVMAAASIAPMLLYQLYAWTRSFGNTRILSYFAYLCYWVGQFMVLLLNRTREYGADHFSARMTEKPAALSTALVKIGYGLVQQHAESARLQKQGTSDQKKEARRAGELGTAMGLLGIMGAHGSEALALGIETPEAAARVMRWDLVNPWARFYELNSTHPLTALRLRALNAEAKALHQEPVYPVSADSRTRWAGFPVQFLFWLAPLACGFVLFTWFWLSKDLRELGFVPPQFFVPALLTALGVTWAARIAFRYQGAFRPAQVVDLLEDLDVSQMRPRAVELTGEVIGHGVPGAFWSPDLVLRDDSGLMFLLYRSSVPFGRFLFAIRSADRFVGERVTVRGWYRRGLKPYLELSRISSKVAIPQKGSGFISLRDALAQPTEYEQLTERSYSHYLQYAAAAACTAAGLFWPDRLKRLRRH